MLAGKMDGEDVGLGLIPGYHLERVVLESLSSTCVVVFYVLVLLQGSFAWLCWRVASVRKRKAAGFCRFILSHCSFGPKPDIK